MAAWIVVMIVILLAVAYVFYNYFRIRKMGEGTADMIEMAEIIRSGAATFMKTEYKTISVVVVLVALVFSLFVERTSGITFLLGACMSSCVCILGMRSATFANVRTSNKARESLSIGETVKVALCGGSISGLAVQAFGMLGFVLVLLIWNGIEPDAVGHGLLANLEFSASLHNFFMRYCLNGTNGITQLPPRGIFTELCRYQTSHRPAPVKAGCRTFGMEKDHE